MRSRRAAGESGQSGGTVLDARERGHSQEGIRQLSGRSDPGRTRGMTPRRGPVHRHQDKDPSTRGD